MARSYGNYKRQRERREKHAARYRREKGMGKSGCLPLWLEATFSVFWVAFIFFVVLGPIAGVGVVLVALSWLVYRTVRWANAESAKEEREKALAVQVTPIQAEFSDGVLRVSWEPDPRVKYWRVVVKAGDTIINEPKTQAGSVTTRSIDLNGVEDRGEAVLTVVVDGENAAEVNVAHAEARVRIKDAAEVNVAYIEEAVRVSIPPTTESLRKETTMTTPYRPNVTGREFPEYDHVGTPDLRNWLKYWEGVDAGTRALTPGSNDTVEMAPSEIAKLRKEVAAREAGR